MLNIFSAICTQPIHRSIFFYRENIHWPWMEQKTKHVKRREKSAGVWDIHAPKTRLNERDKQIGNQWGAQVKKKKETKSRKTFSFNFHFSKAFVQWTVNYTQKNVWRCVHVNEVMKQKHWRKYSHFSYWMRI